MDAAEIKPLQKGPDPLDMSSPGNPQTLRRLDEMSADEVVRYLTDPKDPQFSWAIAALGRKGEAAIPQWCKLMGRDDLGAGFGMTAPQALLGLGDKGLPPLIELLKGQSLIARRTAAWALMKRKNRAQRRSLRWSICSRAATRRQAVTPPPRWRQRQGRGRSRAVSGAAGIQTGSHLLRPSHRGESDRPGPGAGPQRDGAGGHRR